MIHAPAPPVTGEPLGATTRTWTLALSDAPDAPVRVLSLLRRRRCQILSVDYALGDRHRPQTRLDVRVRVRPGDGRSERVTEWLAGLVDVLDVREAR